MCVRMLSNSILNRSVAGGQYRIQRQSNVINLYVCVCVCFNTLHQQFLDFMLEAVLTEILNICGIYACKKVILGAGS